MVRKVDPVTKYAKAVAARKILAGPYVRLAAERHLRDLKREDIEWRATEATEAIRFFEEMLVLGNGQPFKLLDYQAFIVGSIFGWYDRDGIRRFRTAYVEMGKGSGKSPLAAGIGIKLMVADGEKEPHVFSAATTRDQAKILWTDAKGMVERSPELAQLIDVQVGALSIPAESAVFRPVSSEHRGLDGLRVHGGLIDELHEHPSPMVVDKISAGTKACRNALIFEITNSGFDRTSVCWHHHQLSVQVLEGSVVNDEWFAYVCALDEGDDFLRDEKCWPKVNPGMPYGLPPAKYIKRLVGEALAMPSKENIVRRLNGCEWTEQSERWMPMDAWDRCSGAAISWPMQKGRRCWVGFDAASRRDMSAAAFLFEIPGGGYEVHMRYWVPAWALTVEGAKQIQRHEADRLALETWSGMGLITLTHGNVTDYDQIERELLEMCAHVDLQEIAVDRYGITQLITHLQAALGDRVITFAQDMPTMSRAAKELEKVVMEGKLNHGGNPVLRWNAANVAVEHGPKEMIKPIKAAEALKIDGLIAVLMALQRAQEDEGQKSSVYEERGMLTL